MKHQEPTKDRRQTWHTGRLLRRPPSVNAWIDGGWLSVREDSDLLRAPLDDEPAAHVVTWMDRIVSPFSRGPLSAYHALQDELRSRLHSWQTFPPRDDRDADIDATGQSVEIMIGEWADYSEHYRAARFTPAEAREIARKILAAADAAERH